MQPRDPNSFYLEGTGEKAVLLVHGLTGAPAEMRFVGKQLHKRGFTVYAPTLAGHCRDEASLLATTYEDWLDSVHTALHQLKTRAQSISAAGICVGGALALYLAHREPELIDRVAVYGPALNYDGWNQPKWSRLARRFKDVLIHVPGVKAAGFEEKHPFGIKNDRVRQVLMREGVGQESFPAAALYQNYRLNDVLKQALPATRTPTLLIHARQDDVSHPRNSYAIQRLHGGPCEVVLLEDSYHMIHLDQERHQVTNLTADFFGAAERQVQYG